MKQFLFLISILLVLSTIACPIKAETNTVPIMKESIESMNQERETSSLSHINIPNRPPKNPFLVDGLSGLSHWDPAQTDSTVVPAPSGIKKIPKKKIQRIPGGLINICYVSGPVYPTGEQTIWLANNNRIAKVLIDDEQFELISEFKIPGQSYLSPQDADAVTDKLDSFESENELLAYINKNFPKYAEDIAVRAGVYPMMDYEGNFYTVVNDSIMVFGDKHSYDPFSEIELKRKFTLPKELLNPNMRLSDALLGLNLTYDGKVVFVTGGGVVGVIDRYFKEQVQYIKLRGETISNSFSLDEKGGIYVVSSKYMHKFVWNGKKLSDNPKDGAWKSEYEVGEAAGGIKLDVGSGSTPTLMGFGDDKDKLVVITDGSKVMNIVAFWRDEIPTDFKQQSGTKSRRIAGQMKVNFGQNNLKEAQSEQSVAILGYGAFVVNNSLPDKLPTKLENVVVSGVTRPGPKGVEKFEWDFKTHEWKRAWANPNVSSPSVVPMVSAGSNQAYFNGYVDGAWEITGLDWDTGKVKTRLILGDSQAYNGAYSLIQVLPDGDIVYGGLTGYLRIDAK
ncbi:hypothetical protein B1B04_09555 [Lysinibacillus sp. KCTC 33748]|uniref:hypothetical protein n=1 Tax=unclassified Lysinibacillus TaxID=2636778 RepID=UPI0009A55E78|nr:MULTISPECIES: hypothetical protein [unclassified Lysinibacillus]OXS74357.1 hypothetical protein B1B04_09555 [Lysinibacillus sp. KCTC 33748]SKB64986.1 hypothetical protein SAMN06295926_10594 [Lysinibacillus sp. AC-3]